MFVGISINVCQDRYGYKPLMKKEKLNVIEPQAFTLTYLQTFFISNNAI